MQDLTNIEYEKCLLGSMLLEDVDIDSIVMKVDRVFFSVPQNRTVYDQVLNLKRQGICC